MANASTVRQWARENGHGQVRGKLPGSVTDAWDAAHPDDPYQVHQVNGSISAEEMDDLFPGPAGADSIDDGYDTGEVKPSRPATRPKARTPAARTGWPSWGKKDAKAKKSPPRVSTASLIGGMWRGMAKLATPMPPLYRTLRIQSVVAGPLLEDAVKGTVVDTVLQPFARAAERGKVINALLGPPVIITALNVHVAQQASRGLPPNEVIMGMGTELLRSSLVGMLEIAGPEFERALEREREFEEKHGANVDQLMAWLFSPPPSRDDTAGQAAEEMMFAKVMGAAEPATM